MQSASARADLLSRVLDRMDGGVRALSASTASILSLDAHTWVPRSHGAGASRRRQGARAVNS
jgi:hypothetical protein